MTRTVVRVPRLECLAVAPIGNETEQLLIAPPHDRLNSFSDHSAWVVDDGCARITGSSRITGSFWQLSCKSDVAALTTISRESEDISCLDIRSSWALPRSHSQSACRLAWPRPGSTVRPWRPRLPNRQPSSTRFVGFASEIDVIGGQTIKASLRSIRGRFGERRAFLPVTFQKFAVPGWNSADKIASAWRGR